MFIITSDPRTYHAPNLMTWGHGQVWGPVNVHLNRDEFDTREEAATVLSTIPEQTRRFYHLRVAPVTCSPSIALGGNGWMVGHPGYDSMR